METAVVCLSIALALVTICVAATLPLILWRTFKHDRDIEELDNNFTDLLQELTSYRTSTTKKGA